MGNKGWSILFGVVMLACGLSFVVAPFVGWWRPEAASAHGPAVDFLFDIILYITGFFFFLTEGIFVAFLWLYASNHDGKPPVSEKAEPAGFLKPLTGILNNQHRIEMAWTFIPAVILLYIAFAQVNTWADIKYASRHQSPEWSKGRPGDTPTLQIAVSARQFEWRMRYPSVERFREWKLNNPDKKADYDSFGKFEQRDDIRVIVNELHIYQDQPVVIHLTTRDVIHSFNLPNFRVKQDALPGKMIPVWFRTIDSKFRKTHNCKFDASKRRYVDGINPETGKEDPNFIYDIPCAELCGWGHYRMIGRVFVHENEGDFLKWLEHAEKINRQTTRD